MIVQYILNCCSTKMSLSYIHSLHTRIFSIEKVKLNQHFNYFQTTCYRNLWNICRNMAAVERVVDHSALGLTYIHTHTHTETHTETHTHIYLMDLKVLTFSLISSTQLGCITLCS